MREKPLKTLFLLGAGGHAISCIDVIQAERKYKVIGAVEQNRSALSLASVCPIIGYEDEIEQVLKLSPNFLVAFAGAKLGSKRETSYLSMVKKGATPVNIISPSAYLTQDLSIGIGNIIMHSAILNSCVQLGSNCIINTRATIEHQSKIGDSTHIAPGVIVNGNVEIGSRCFIGSGAIIFPGVKIGDDCIVGAGEIIRRNVQV